MDQSCYELAGREDIEGPADHLQCDQDHGPPGACEHIAAVAITAYDQDQQRERQQPEQASEIAVQDLNTSQGGESGQERGAAEGHLCATGCNRAGVFDQRPAVDNQVCVDHQPQHRVLQLWHHLATPRYAVDCWCLRRTPGQCELVIAWQLEQADRQQNHTGEGDQGEPEVDGEDPGQFPLALEGDRDGSQSTLEHDKQQAQSSKDLDPDIVSIQEPGADGHDQHKKAIGACSGAVAVFYNALDGQGSRDDLPPAKRPGIAAALARARGRDQHSQQDHHIGSQGGHEGSNFHQTVYDNHISILLCLSDGQARTVGSNSCLALTIPEVAHAVKGSKASQEKFLHTQLTFRRSVRAMLNRGPGDASSEDAPYEYGILQGQAGGLNGSAGRL
jgi:hypothetical protein